MAKKSEARSGTAVRRSVRDRVFAAAGELFARQGIRAVGVDAITKQAGVPKVGLYRNFASKDDLMVAYLQDRGTTFWRHWDQTLARHEGDPRAQLNAIMTYLADRTTQPGYRGCPFINCAIEFPEPTNPGRQLAEAVKREMRLRLRGLAEALGAPDPEQAGDGLMLLVEGAYAASQTLGGHDGPGKALSWAAEALLQAGMTTGSTAADKPALS
jgi:AcrR family transcriptional regulator